MIGISVTSASAATTYRQGVPSNTGGFKTTVTRVETGLAATPGPRPVKARNGQFVLVYVTAQNLGNAPATFHIGEAELIDSAGHRFATSYDVLVAVGPIGNDGFNDDEQPGATTHGWIPFDVPTTIKAVSAVSLLPDDSGDVPPAVVRLS